jgi:hypothetical protein
VAVLKYIERWRRRQEHGGIKELQKADNIFLIGFVTFFSFSFACKMQGTVWQ